MRERWPRPKRCPARRACELLPSRPRGGCQPALEGSRSPARQSHAGWVARTTSALERPARVHRMADDGVRSGRDDPLAGHDLNGRCRVAVDAIDEEDEVVANRHEDVTEDDGPDRNGRPSEVTVERGHDEQRDEAERRDVMMIRWVRSSSNIG